MKKLTLLLVLSLAAAGCSPRLIGAKTGGFELEAVYNDIQDLSVGNSVMVAGVKVGAVTDVSLDGKQARVAFSLPESRKIPVRTVAALTTASVLGEWIVDLRIPSDVDRAKGPFHRDGDELPTTEEANLEVLADKAADVLGAIQADDFAAIIEAAFIGVGGKGDNLNRIVGDLETLAGVLAGQRSDLAAAVDGFGRFGSSVARGSEEVGALVDDLAEASGSLAVNRNKFVATVRELTRFAKGLNDQVIEPHGERLSKMISDLDPIVATLSENRGKLEDLIDGLDIFQNKLHRTIVAEMVTLFVWLSGVCDPAGGCTPLPMHVGTAFDLLEPPQ